MERDVVTIAHTVMQGLYYHSGTYGNLMTLQLQTNWMCKKDDGIEQNSEGFSTVSDEFDHRGASQNYRFAFQSITTRISEIPKSPPDVPRTPHNS